MMRVEPVSELSKRLADAKGDRSIDAIADEATRRGHSISRAVVAKYVAGDHGTKPPESTLLGLAAGLHLDVRELRELANRPGGELEPWKPPAVAASLTREQRKALDALIVAIVNGDPDAGKSAEKSVKLRQVTERPTRLTPAAPQTPTALGRQSKPPRRG